MYMQNSVTTQQRNTPYQWVILGLLCVPVFLGSLDLTVVSAFLPNLISELRLTLNADGIVDVTWLLTGYLLAYSISLFTMGRVSDLIGRRLALTICLSLYIVGSGLVVFFEIPTAFLEMLYSALQIDMGNSDLRFQGILLARIVAAFGAGAITSIALALVGDMFDAEERSVPLGIIAATDTIGWLLGAAWGGLVIQFLPWQAIFLINMPLVLIALFLMLWVLNQVPQNRAEGRFDYLGFVALVGVLVSLNITLVNITSPETGVNIAGTLRGLALTGVIFAVFIVTQLRSSYPLINLRLFRDKNIRTATLINLLIGFCMFIPLVSLPLLVNIQRLDSIGFAGIIVPIRNSALQDASLETGLLLAAFTIPLAIASVMGGWLVDRVGALWTTISGILLAALAFWALWQILTIETSSYVVGGMMMILGFGIGLTFTPIIATTFRSITDEERGMASALILGVRMVGMTISTSMLSAFVSQRIADRVVAVEQGRLFFELVAPEDYATVFSTTYITSAVLTVGEMALFGAVFCAIALLPAFILPRRFA